VGLIFEPVPGDLRRVQRVWTAQCDDPTGFSSMAKATPMIAVARIAGQTTVHLRGPETKATPMVCSADTEFFGVELRPGAYFPAFPPAGLADLNDAVLPILDGGRILLDNRAWEIPTSQNADVFVERLERAGLLTFDPLVEEIQHGERVPGLSARMVQLRFRRAVGLSRRKLSSIERARAAARLLAAGLPISQVVATAGYYDQPQMTRAFRHLLGHTPGELATGRPFLTL
jgi:hypothetical protein